MTNKIDVVEWLNNWMFNFMAWFIIDKVKL